MATTRWLNKQEMVEFCRDHMLSVLDEADRAIAPVISRLGADRSGQEKAEAEIYRAARSGDFEATVAHCDSYLKRIALTVKKYTRDETRPVPPQRKAA
jgi:hypothetical protein